MASTRGGRFFATMVGLVLVLGGGAVVGLIVAKRVQTGAWQMPTGDDLVHLKHALTPGAAPAEPPRVIYMVRGPITLTGGDDDDSARLVSSVVEHPGHHHDHAAASSVSEHEVHGPGDDDAPRPGAPPRTVTLRGFHGSSKSWNAIVKCAKDQFAPFNIEVTDQKPTGGNYDIVVIGGRPGDIGAGKGIAGLAPFNGDVIPNAVTFVFADELGNRSRPICEDMAQEIGHAFGLDHEHYCQDVMTYLQGCGAKKYRDVDARCGETEGERDCHGGTRTQNSYRHLMEVLGPRPAAPAPQPR